MLDLEVIDKTEQLEPEVAREYVRRRGYVQKQWSIDRLHERGTISNDQHCAALHIRWWWECFSQSSLRSLSIERIVHERGFDLSTHLIDTITARDCFNRAMRGMQEREQKECKMMMWAACVWLAIDDLSMRRIASRMGGDTGARIEHIKYSLDTLHTVLEERDLFFWKKNAQA